MHPFRIAIVALCLVVGNVACDGGSEHDDSHSDADADSDVDTDTDVDTDADVDTEDTGPTDADGDGWTIAGGDCDDGEASVNP